MWGSWQEGLYDDSTSGMWGKAKAKVSRNSQEQMQKGESISQFLKPYVYPSQRLFIDSSSSKYKIQVFQDL